MNAEEIAAALIEAGLGPEFARADLLWAIRPTEIHDLDMLVRAWAYDALIVEIMALREEEIELSYLGSLRLRFAEWKVACTESIVYSEAKARGGNDGESSIFTWMQKKENWRDARIVARIARHMARARDPRSELEKAARHRPSRWENPEIDVWLLMVWPIVELWEWTSSQLHLIACERFPKAGAMLDNPQKLRRHCDSMDLKFTRAPRGRRKETTPVLWRAAMALTPYFSPSHPELIARNIKRMRLAK